MKATLLAVCFVCLCATAAFGQAAGTSVGAMIAEPQVIQVPSHPQHAVVQPLAQEQSLLQSSNPVSARGKRPLWEVVQVPASQPLGDVARILRKEHDLARKAARVWEN